MATVGGNLLQPVQCWYFRSADFQCIRKGKDFCFAFAGLNQYHAIMDYGTCPAVAPSSAAVALLALNASVELDICEERQADVAIKDFYVEPDANPTKFNGDRARRVAYRQSPFPSPLRARAPLIRNTERRRALTGPSPTREWCWRWTATSAAEP